MLTGNDIQDGFTFSDFTGPFQYQYIRKEEMK